MVFSYYRIYTVRIERLKDFHDYVDCSKQILNSGNQWWRPGPEFGVTENFSTTKNWFAKKLVLTSLSIIVIIAI